MSTNDREYGLVKTFDSFKGFGFIRRQKGKDVFFFYNEILGDDRILFEGDKVSFTVQATPKGPRAYEVEKIA